jgi:dihydroflavonol-4-reductase
LLEAAEKAGVRKAIYVSSSGTIGRYPDGSPGDEADPPAPVTYSNLYFKSKLMAEAAVAHFGQRSAMPVVLICPGAMLGPQDAAPTEFGQFVLDYLNRKIPALLAGGMPTVDVRDVAAAMVAAAKEQSGNDEAGPGGNRYLVVGHYYSMADLMRTLEAVSGVPSPKQKIPGFMMRVLAFFSTWMGRLTGREPDIPMEGIKIMLADLAYDSTKAQRELGVQFRPLEISLADMVAWFRQAGYL